MPTSVEVGGSARYTLLFPTKVEALEEGCWISQKHIDELLSANAVLRLENQRLADLTIHAVKVEDQACTKADR
eukprot:11735013-Karenia_brevis.AAC.1